MKILVTDGDTRASLATTRSLGKKGHRVFVTGKKKKTISSVSKYCVRGYGTVNHVDDTEGFCEDVKHIVTKEAIDLVLPMTDASTVALAGRKECFGTDVIIACPSIEVIRRLYNKYELFVLAQQKRIHIPKTIFVNNGEDFLSKNITDIPFPAVVKPAFSKIQTQNGFISTSVEYADGGNALHELYAGREYLKKYPSLIQEKIEGQGTGLFTLFDGANHLALFSHKRLREKPPWGGVSVYSESISLDPEMVESSRILLSEMGWQGIAMVEFKRDDRDGKAKLIEINGRFWGSLELAIICGINFPSLYIDYLTGKDVNEYERYQVGRRLKWILGDLDNHLIRIKSKKEKLMVLLKEFSRLKDRHTTFDVLKADDIGPFLLEIKEYLFNLLGCKK